MLELEQASFDWPDGSRQLQDISLTLATGECAAVVGASKKAYFGPVNKSRLIVTLSKTL